MGIHPIAGPLAPGGASPVEPRQTFGKLLQQAQQIAGSPEPGRGVATPAAPGGAQHAHAGQAQAVRAPGRAQVSRAPEATAAHAVDQVTQAQRRLDRVLALAESGKTFSPAELLGLQAQVYSASQELDLAGKVVEKATSGVKQILQTQI